MAGRIPWQLQASRSFPAPSLSCLELSQHRAAARAVFRQGCPGWCHPTPEAAYICSSPCSSSLVPFASEPLTVAVSELRGARQGSWWPAVAAAAGRSSPGDPQGVPELPFISSTFPLQQSWSVSSEFPLQLPTASLID